MVNDYRKHRELQLSDKIVLTLATEDQELIDSINEHKDYIMSETQAIELHIVSTIDEPLAVEHQIGEANVSIFLTVAVSEHQAG